MELTISAEWVSRDGRRQSHLLEIGPYIGYVECSGPSSDPSRRWTVLHRSTRIASGHTRGHKADQAAAEAAIHAHNQEQQ